jgi:hypothetical protein
MVGGQKNLALEEECLLHQPVLEFKYQYTYHIKETQTATHYNLQNAYTKIPAIQNTDICNSILYLLIWDST